MEDRDVARAIALGRIALGGAFVLAPRRAARAWTGEDHAGVTAAMAARSLGARDLALGMGALLALEHGSPVRGWIEAGAIADASDAFSTLANWRRLPRLRRLLAFAPAAAAAVLGFRVAGSLD